jgi:hypothetical protein
VPTAVVGVVAVGRVVDDERRETPRDADSVEWVADDER